MARWTIYDKGGNPRHWYHAESDDDGNIVRQDTLELHDEWMAECFLTVSIRNAEPIDFAVGDYIDYRGERYVIDYEPTVLKKARRGSYAEGFTYDNIKFVHKAQAEIVRCDFTDIVLNDNGLHYTSLPTFGFYCETVDDLLDRIQANLEELFPGAFCIIGLNRQRALQRGRLVGREQAFATAFDEYVGGDNTDYGSKGVAITVDDITCWDALTKVHSDFGLNFIQRGYTLIIGTAGFFTSKTFEYGKGNGLYEIEKIGDSSQKIITLLRSYGSEDNIPTNYYANLHRKATFTVSAKREEPSQIQGDTSRYRHIVTTLRWNQVKNAFTRKVKDATYAYNVTLTFGAYTAVVNAVGIWMEDTELMMLQFYFGKDETYLDFFNAVQVGSEVFISEGVEVSKWPSNLVKQDPGFNYPAALVMNRLMLPGFPDQSLYDWVLENGWTTVDESKGEVTKDGVTVRLSKDPLRPSIESLNADVYGVRPGSIYFDGTNDNPDIKPTITGMGVDTIATAEQINDSGVYTEGEIPKFTITLPDLGFDLSEYWEDGASIDMTDGMCGGRSFKFDRPEQNQQGQWECKCSRSEDTTLHLWYPYCDFQINTGDHYVLTGIRLPKAYVEAASERLFDASIEALFKNHAPRVTYQPRIDELWMQREHDNAQAGKSLHDTLKAGDIFKFKDNDLGIDAGIIIDVLTIKENGNNGIPTYEVTLRDEKEVGTIQKIQNKVDSLANGGNGVSSGVATGPSVTSAQIETLVSAAGADYFLSKQNDDTAQGEIGFIRGLWVKAKGLFGFSADGDVTSRNVNADGNAQIAGNTAIGGNTTVDGGLRVGGLIEGRQAWLDTVQSSDFSGHSSTGGGWGVTNDYYGRSRLTVDELYVRARAIFEELLVKKKEVTGGDQIQSCVASYVSRIDFLKMKQDGTYEVMGYETVSVPWLLGLRRMLGRLLSPSQRPHGDMSGIWSRKKKVFVGVTEDQLPEVSRVRCYFLAKDDDREIENWWKVGDLAYCKTLDLFGTTNRLGYSSSRTGTAASNIEYWRRVVNVSGNPVQTDNKSYHFFDVAYDHATNDVTTNDWKGGSDIPAQGDSVVQLGHMPSDEELHDPAKLRLAEERMNALTLEVNGGGNEDAPCIKILYGIYRYDLQECWFGGPTVRMKLSPKTGYEFYGPSFRFITQHDDARVMLDRQEVEWQNIAFDYDEGSQGASREPVYSDDILDEQGQFVRRNDGGHNYDRNYVRKVWYLERVSHNGSIWVCKKQDTAYWVNGSGQRISDDDYASLPYEQRILCTRRLEYTNQEPAVGASDWVQQVSKGGFKSRAFCRTNTDISNIIPQGGTNVSPIPNPMTVGGETITWSDGAPNDNGHTLWSTTAWFYADGSTPIWTPPTRETDNQTQDLEFSFAYNQPAVPYGDDAKQKDSAEYKEARHAQGWYDPNDTLPAGKTWDMMIWRAERKIANAEYSGAWAIARVKGESANRLDLTNMADLISIDSEGKVRFTRTISTTVRLFEGGTKAVIGKPTVVVTDASGHEVGLQPTFTPTSGTAQDWTLTWNFSKGTTVSRSYDCLITVTLRNVEYTASFTIGTTESEALYQVVPNPSEVSFTRISSNNSLSPDYIDLVCGYTKFTGSGSTTTAAPTASKIDDYNYLYYRVKADNGSWGSWRAYTGYIRVSKNTTDTDYEFAISTASSATGVNDANAYEREVVPIVKDGEHGDSVTGMPRSYAVSALSQPESGRDYPSDIQNWTQSSPPVSEEKPYLWCKEEIVYKYKSTNDVRYYYVGKLGDPGIDAKDAEWVYVRTKDKVIPAVPTQTESPRFCEENNNYNQDDHLPYVRVLSDYVISGSTDPVIEGGYKYVKCTDDPQGVDETWKFEWVLKRTKGSAVNGHRSWEPYSGAMAQQSNYSESAFIIDLDNEEDQFGTDSESVVAVNQPRSTGVTMYYGTTAQVLNADNASTPGVTAVLKYSDDDANVPTSVAQITRCRRNPSDTTNGEVEVTVYRGTFPTSKNGIYALITATCEKGSKSARFTLSKLMGGAPGENPTMYQLDLSQKSLAYGRDADNSLTPKSNSVQVRVKKTYYDETTGDYKSTIISSAMTSPAITYKWGFENEASPASGHSGLAIGTSVTIAPASVGTHTKIWIQLESTVSSDKEEVPITVDGENGKNAVRLALDNQHEDFLYDDQGNCVLPNPSTGALSAIHLYDGNTDVISQLPSGALTISSRTGTTSTLAYLSGTTLVVKGMSSDADSVSVTVKATYKDEDYYATFTGNKTNQDKYDLIVEPSSLAYNPANYSTKRLKVYSNVTTLAGGTTKADIGRNSSDVLQLWVTYVKNVYQSTWETVTEQMSTSNYSTSEGKFFIDITAALAEHNDGIYFELRKYNSAHTSFVIKDYETVEIAKAENGANGTNGTNGADGKYKLSVYQANASTPDKPTGTSVDEGELNEDDWWFSPDEALSHSGGSRIPMSYTNSGVWTRNNDTFTTPSSLSHNTAYRTRISFTTSVPNVKISIILATNSELNWDFGCVGDIDRDLSGETASSIKSGTFPAKASGPGGSATCTLTVASAGSHFFDIVYAKDATGGPTGTEYASVSILYASVATSQIWECETWVDKDAQGTEYALGWSDPVKWNGADGAPGPKGNDGLQGCSVRISEWKQYSYYRNDEGKTLGANSVGYIDVVCVETDDTTTYPEGYMFYQLIAGSYDGDSYRSTTSPGNDSSHWVLLSNVGPIYTSLLIAKNAYIKFGSGNQFVIFDDEGDIKAGMKGTGNIRFWAGSTASSAADTNIGRSPFRVYEDGSVVMTDADVKGTVKAQLFYGATKIITGSYPIDLDNEPYYTYFKRANDTGDYTITLPNPTTYDGVELRFFSPVVGGQGGSILHISYSGGIMVVNTSNEFVSRTTVNLTARKFGTVKAIDGQWWTIDDGFQTPI